MNFTVNTTKHIGETLLGLGFGLGLKEKIGMALLLIFFPPHKYSLLIIPSLIGLTDQNMVRDRVRVGVRARVRV